MAGRLLWSRGEGLVAYFMKGMHVEGVMMVINDGDGGRRAYLASGVESMSLDCSPLDPYHLSVDFYDLLVVDEVDPNIMINRPTLENKRGEG